MYKEGQILISKAVISAYNLIIPIGTKAKIMGRHMNFPDIFRLKFDSINNGFTIYRNETFLNSNFNILNVQKGHPLTKIFK